MSKENMTLGQFVGYHTMPTANGKTQAENDAAEAAALTMKDELNKEALEDEYLEDVFNFHVMLANKFCDAASVLVGCVMQDCMTCAKEYTEMRHTGERVLYTCFSRNGCNVWNNLETAMLWRNTSLAIMEVTRSVDDDYCARVVYVKPGWEGKA